MSSITNDDIGVSGTLAEVIHDDLSVYDVFAFGSFDDSYDDSFEYYDDSDVQFPAEMDGIDTEFEEEREAETKRPNFKHMQVAREVSARHEVESRTPTAIEEQFFKAFREGRL